MKKTTLLLLSLLVATLVFGQPNPNQAKIEAAMNESFVSQSNQIEPVIDNLQQDKTANVYWIAFARFYSSIYYLHTDQKDKAEAQANEAIDLLENIEEKSSEEHALLGYILGYSIAFNPSVAARTSGKAVAQYRAALKKDEKNLRAYLGLGESDYYTPAEYGGGTKVEEYLVKAISLPEQTIENGPSWGKNTAYHTLSSFYLREGQLDKAKMYCMQGLSQYPDDYQLNQLKQSF